MSVAAGPSRGFHGWTGDGRHAALPYAFLIGCVLLVYANVLRAGFVADDSSLLSRASRVRTVADAIALFTTPVRLSPFLAPTETLAYRPAYYLYGALAYRLWGSRTWAWHAANVLFHAIAACLILLSLRRLFGLPPGLALIASLLWAVHPVHVQAVAWANAATYLLMGIFLLVAVLVTCGWWPATWPWPCRALAAVGAFAISVLSHELGLMAPALAALALAAPRLGWTSGHRPDRGALAVAGAMGAAALAYLLFRASVIGTGEAGQLGRAMTTVGSRLLQAPEIFLRYLALLAFPARLTLDRSHDVPIPAWALEPRVLVTGGICLLLLLGAVCARRRVPLALFGVCWFLLAYFPTSNTLIPLYSVMGEQYIYIASAGIVAAAVAAVWAVALAQGIPRAATLGAMLLVAAYAARSVVRTRDWRDELSFYRATVAASPQSAFMHVELGTTHLVRGELALAEREFRTALTLNPSYAPAHFNLGITALVQGRLDEAESFLRRSLALRPDYAPAHFNMGVLASRRGQTQDAIHWFESAAAIDPERAETHLALGKAYLPINSHRAAQHLRRFLALAPEHPEAPAVRSFLLTIPASPRPAR